MAQTKRRNARSIHIRVPTTSSESIPTTGKVVLGVILAATVVVTFSVVIALLFNPERITKNEFETLVRNYYEEYFYPKITNLEELEKHTESGLSLLHLRQLILHEPSLGMSTYLEKYCDTNTSLARIFPQKPYGKKDYRIEYKYNCEW